MEPAKQKVVVVNRWGSAALMYHRRLVDLPVLPDLSISAVNDSNSRGAAVFRLNTVFPWWSQALTTFSKKLTRC